MKLLLVRVIKKANYSVWYNVFFQDPDAPVFLVYSNFINKYQLIGQDLFIDKDDCEIIKEIA